jgi:hypothetical protein
MTADTYLYIDPSQLIKRGVPMGPRILQERPMEINTTTPGVCQAKGYSVCPRTAELQR